MNENHLLTRRHDIDWLRNLGIFLLFPFHTARVFDYWDPFYVKDEQLSWLLSWFIAATSYWFMPLLFWLAGTASWYALRRRPYGTYIRERVERLLIPLVVGLLIVVPPQGYVARLVHEGTAESYGSFLMSFFTDYSDLSGYYGTFTPAHLWFILYLFVLSLLALPLFLYLVRNQGRSHVEAFHRLFSKPYVFLSLVIVLALTQALPAPGGQNPFFFLVILIMGFICGSDPRYQDMFDRMRSKLLLLLIITVPGWMVLSHLYRDAADYSAIDISLTFLRMLNVCVTIIVVLGFGHKLLNVPHRWLPYLNEAAFPIYIVHQTVLVAVAYYVTDWPISTVWKFCAIMSLSLHFSWLIYEWLIKRTAVTRRLFGVKMR